MRTHTSDDITPGGQPLELLFERGDLPSFALPAALSANYGGTLGFDSPCLFANFVCSVDGVVALPGDTESGQIISGRNPADRFVMGLLRACADAVLVGAGTFRKGAGHLWHPGPYLSRGSWPLCGSSSGPRARGAAAIRAPQRERGARHRSARHPGRSHHHDPRGRAQAARAGARLHARRGARRGAHRAIGGARFLRAQGIQRVLTEGGPTLVSELIARQLLDQLFVTSSPSLFGRFAGDQRKSLAEGLDLGGAPLELMSVRRHACHLFLRYALG